MSNSIYDIIIVGAGPAGMTAALYARRSDKTVLILEKENFGGQIALAPKVENFPTLESTTGQELADKLLNQIMELGTEFELEEVFKIEKENDIFTVTTNYNEYQSRTVIIATGAKHKKMGLEKEEEFLGKGLSYCAVCDGAFFKNEEVAVIGDANSALQYALDLSTYCPKVYVCTLFDCFFGDQILVDRLLQKENIEIIHNISLIDLKGTDSLEGLVFENTKTKEHLTIPVKGVFIAIGQVPNNEIVKNLVDIDNQGYVITDETLLTKTKGLFVAGDCRTKNVRQATTAVSDGAIAAIQAIKLL